MPTTPLRITAIILLAILVSACAGNAPGPTAPEAADPSDAGSSSDPCAPENLPVTVQPLNENMRQFDNQASLSRYIARAEAGLVLPPMQSIIQSAKDQTVPACLDDLKSYQLQYMEMTLETMEGVVASTVDADARAAGLLEAHEYHDKYDQELARLLAAP